MATAARGCMPALAQTGAQAGKSHPQIPHTCMPTTTHRPPHRAKWPKLGALLDAAELTVWGAAHPVRLPDDWPRLREDKRGTISWPPEGLPGLELLERLAACIEAETSRPHRLGPMSADAASKAYLVIMGAAVAAIRHRKLAAASVQAAEAALGLAVPVRWAGGQTPALVQWWSGGGFGGRPFQVWAHHVDAPSPWTFTADTATPAFCTAWTLPTAPRAAVLLLTMLVLHGTAEGFR